MLDIRIQNTKSRIQNGLLELLTVINCLPYQSHLYSIMVLNWYQLAFAIALAKW